MKTLARLEKTDLLKLIERQKSLLDSAEVQIWSMVDPKTYGLVNKAHAKFLGVKQKDLEFKKITERSWEKNYIKKCLESNKKVFETKKEVKAGELVPNSKGELRFLYIIKTPKIKKGSVEEVICFAVDITDEKGYLDKLEHSAVRNGSLIEHLPDMIFHYNSKGVYLDAQINKLNVMYFHGKEFYDEKSLIGRNIKEVLPDKVSKSILKMIREVLQEGKIRRVEYSYHIEGVRYTLESRLIKVGEDEVMAVVRDITKAKRLQEDLEYQIRFSELVARVSAYFAGLLPQEIDKGINHALRIMGEFCDVDRAYVFRTYDDGKKMSNTHEWCAKGIRPEISKCKDLNVDEFDWFVKELHEKLKVHVYDVSELPPEAEKAKQSFLEQNIQSVLCIPMFRKGVFEGFLGFDSVRRRRKWTKENIFLLRVVAELVSNTFVRFSVDQEIRKLTFHDRLTGVYNRLYLENEIKRLDTQRQRPISIIMADLNGLKLINDTYGHESGDKMLKSAADVFRKSCRDEDIVTRWGGDEFIIFLPKTPLEEAQKICKRIKSKASQIYIEDIPLTMALGVAVKRDKGKSVAQVITRAEDRMYKDKFRQKGNDESKILKTILKTLAQKSHVTPKHIEEMGKIGMEFGEKLNLPKTELKRLSQLISIQDIGKITVLEDILIKADRLKEPEFAKIKEHPETGYRIASATKGFAYVASDILHHHEKWDGTGYPKGLKGEDIPLLARVVTIVDAYVAMKNGRAYKNPMPYDEIIKEFDRCAGKHFDPSLIPIFKEMLIKK